MSDTNQILKNPNQPLGNNYGINTFEEYKEHFLIVNNLKVNSGYSEAKIHFFNLAHSDKFIKLTKELNLTEQFTKSGKSKGVSAQFDAQVNAWINQIKNAKITEVKFKVLNGKTQISQEIAQALQQKWEGVLNLMRTQQWSNLNTELQILESYTSSLKNSLSNASNGSLIDLNTIMGEGDAYTLASRIEGLLSRIQGEVLEQEVKKFLARKLPAQIAVTGSITLDTGGKIKPDLIAAISDCLTLQNAQGETTYMFRNGEILNANGIPVTGTVTLTAPELQQLTENTLGFSAKTSSGRTTFHQGYNINQLIQDALGKEKSPAIYQLMHFYQLGLQDVPDLDAYQRYAVSKLAVRILGENNAFIITKTKIIPTYQYVEKIMNKGLSFVNKQIPARAGNIVLNDQFGNTNIVGPKV